KTATEIASLIESQLPGSRHSTISLAGYSTELDNLPAGIAPGRYRVVDSSGTISSLVVSESTIGSRRSVVSRAMYTLHRNGVTRYFIRVEDTAPEIASIGNHLAD
ncbi:MAG: hypothetical protein ACYTGL_30695, partial [Planctomycetota bacterium]